jgi:predicted DNA-binding antitoxin AbrB/MazE fold protein
MIKKSGLRRKDKIMTITTEAIYENGVLKLSQPIPLAEGTRVEVMVMPAATSGSFNPTPGEILAKIAALPLEGNQEEFSGQDHDKILYPPSSSI